MHAQETMIAKGENNEDLYQPAEWRAAREKVLRNVKEARPLSVLCQPFSQVRRADMGVYEH